MRIAVVGVLALSLSACGGAALQNETPEQAAATAQAGANRIAVDVPPSYRAAVAEFYKRTLKDPYSIRDAGISEPKVGFVGLLNGGTGTAVCVRMNAKNSFGAYIGLRASAVVFNSGKITNVMDDPQNEPLICQNAVYGPFPELSKS